MQLSHTLLLALTTIAAVSAASKIDDLHCIEISASRCNPKHPAIVVTSMPEVAPTTVGDMAEQQLRSLPAVRRPHHHHQETGLTARQVVGGIAVAVLVAVI